MKKLLLAILLPLALLAVTACEELPLSTDTQCQLMDVNIQVARVKAVEAGTVEAAAFVLVLEGQFAKRCPNYVSVIQLE